MYRIIIVRGIAFVFCEIIKAIAFPFWLLKKWVSCIQHLFFKMIVFCRKKTINENKTKKRKIKRKPKREKKNKKKTRKKTQKKKRKKARKKTQTRKFSPETFAGKTLKLYFTDQDSRTVIVMKKCFWKCFYFMRKCYWKIKVCSQKLYWLFRRVYSKIYWSFRWVYSKVYWSFRWVYSKVYWSFRWLYSKIYWSFRWLYSKIYWSFRWLYSKIYWSFRWLYSKVYWTWRRLFSKLYWKGYTIFHKIYWKSRFYCQHVYYFFTRWDYAELFLIFVRSNLKKQPINYFFAPITSVEGYLKRYPDKGEYDILEKSTDRTVCIPEYFEKNKMQLEHFTSPDIYVAKIENVSIIGGSNVLVANGMLLNDAAYADTEKRIDIRYSSIKKVINGIALIQEEPLTDTFEKAIYLVGAASFNYYHLIVEILSRLTFVDTCEKYWDYPILVDEICLKIPQFKTALNYMNSYHRKVIVAQKEKKYEVKEMIIPSSNVWMPTNVYQRNSIKTSDFMISKTVLDNIRKKVNLYEEQKPERKIFISRKNTTAVRLKNEEEIRQIFEQNGFEIIYTEEMTFEQQVACFGQAKCIVATSGAALTNTIFCQKGTVLGCIIPSYHRFFMYSTIAYLLEMKPIFLDAKITELTPYAAADTFVLDKDYAERYIKYIYKKIGD